jgi:4-hydroxybenzoate polyprenyltransferase
VRGLLRASHFQPTVVVTAITATLASIVGRGAPGVVAVVAAVLAGQLSVGWSNDWADRDRDRRAGRRDKPIVAGAVEATTVGRAAIIALVLTVPLSMLSGWRAGVVHVVAVLAAWAYNLGLKRTAASPACYLVAFGLLPAFVTLGLPGHPWPPIWATGAAALMGAGAHFVNGLADREADKRTGVRGLPQRISYLGGLLTGAGLLAVALALIAVGPPDGPSAGTVGLLVVGFVALAAVVVAALTRHERAAWSLTLVTAVSAVVALVLNGDALVA